MSLIQNKQLPLGSRSNSCVYKHYSRTKYPKINFSSQINTKVFKLHSRQLRVSQLPFIQYVTFKPRDFEYDIFIQQLTK